PPGDAMEPLRPPWRQPLSQHALVELLEADLERLEEASAVGAVDQPMVVSQREIRHRPRLDPVIVDDDSALVDTADGEDRNLRLVDDRQAPESAEDTRVRHGERARFDLLDLQLL